MTDITNGMVYIREVVGQHLNANHLACPNCSGEQQIQLVKWGVSLDDCMLKCRLCKRDGTFDEFYRAKNSLTQCPDCVELVSWGSICEFCQFCGLCCECLKPNRRQSK